MISISLLLFTALVQAQSFDPIPMPPGTLDAPPARDAAPDDDDYVDTDAAPEMVLARAHMDLARGQDLEVSATTQDLYRKWQAAAARGPTTGDARLAQARYLTAYTRDLEAAREIYRRVESSLAGFNSRQPTEDRLAPMMSEANQLLTELEDDQSLADAACFVDPTNCNAPDSRAAKLLQDIDGLKVLLTSGGADGSLSAEGVRTSARLMRIRADLAIELSRRLALKVAAESAADHDKVSNLLHMGQAEAASKSPVPYKPRSPY